MDNTNLFEFNEIQSQRIIDIDEGATPNIPGYKETVKYSPAYAKDSLNASNKKQKRSIAKIFSQLSRFGMMYEDDIVKNMRAIPADKNLLPKQDQLINQDLFGQGINAWKQKTNKDKNFFEKDFGTKRDALRKLALQPELEDILDTMTDECIVYDSDYMYFAEPFIDKKELQYFSAEIQDKITNTMIQSFRKLYKSLNWKTAAWDDFKRFLIEGDLAWEIVFDSLEKPTNILGLIPLDVATLTKKYENGKLYWIQYKGIAGKERKLLDTQIVYIQYQETNISPRVSYLERLIRPFNIYRIIEQAQIIWTLTNASYKTKFTIPTKGMNKMNATQTVSSAMNRFKEDIKFISDTGEVKINGQPNLPFNKEYWLSENEAGTPQIDVLGGEGPELNDNDQLRFFRNQLYKISKIPLTRFDAESGETWFGTDASSVARTEINFARFIQRLRNIFSQIILKPIQIQLAISIPELAEHKDFLNVIQLQYKSYNLFEEMMEMELMQKRVDFISSIKESMIDMDKEGNEVKFFSSKFLVEKYLKLSDIDLKLNDRYKKEEMEEWNLPDGESTMEAKKDNKSKVITDSGDNKKVKNKEEEE